MRLYHERHLKSSVYATNESDHATTYYFISKMYCELYFLRLFTLTVHVIVVNILEEFIYICSCFNLLHGFLINVGSLNLYNFYVMFAFMVIILLTLQKRTKYKRRLELRKHHNPFKFSGV
jgi:hypothetical protein